MAIVKTIYYYEDANGNVWEIERVVLNKLTTRGQYVYWQAECKALNKSLRGTLKREVINQIKTIKKTENGTSNQL